MAHRGAREVAPELALQGEVVDLDHHPVDLVVEVVAVLLPLRRQKASTSSRPCTSWRSGLTGNPARSSQARVRRLGGGQRRTWRRRRRAATARVRTSPTW